MFLRKLNLYSDGGLNSAKTFTYKLLPLKKKLFWKYLCFKYAGIEEVFFIFRLNSYDLCNTFMQTSKEIIQEIYVFRSTTLDFE